MSQIANVVAGTVVLALTSIAGYLVPAVPGAEAIFNVTAVGSGLAGYWLGRSIAVETISILSRAIIAILSLLFTPLLAYVYLTFVNLPFVSLLWDIFGFLAFSFLFGLVGLMFGLNQVDLLGRSNDAGGTPDRRATGTRSV